MTDRSYSLCVLQCFDLSVELRPPEKIAWIPYGNWPTSRIIAYDKFETTNVTVIIHDVAIRRYGWLFRLDKIEVPPEEAVVSSDDLQVESTVFQTIKKERTARASAAT